MELGLPPDSVPMFLHERPLAAASAPIRWRTIRACPPFAPHARLQLLRTWPRTPGADGVPPDNGDPERQHRHVTPAGGQRRVQAATPVRALRSTWSATTFARTRPAGPRLGAECVFRPGGQRPSNRQVEARNPIRVLCVPMRRSVDAYHVTPEHGRRQGARTLPCRAGHFPPTVSPKGPSGAGFPQLSPKFTDP